MNAATSFRPNSNWMINLPEIVAVQEPLWCDDIFTASDSSRFPPFIFSGFPDLQGSWINLSTYIILAGKSSHWRHIWLDVCVWWRNELCVWFISVNGWRGKAFACFLLLKTLAKGFNELMSLSSSGFRAQILDLNQLCIEKPRIGLLCWCDPGGHVYYNQPNGALKNAQNIIISITFLFCFSPT